MKAGFVRRCHCGEKHTLTLEQKEITCSCGKKLSLKGNGPEREALDLEETPITISPMVY